MVASSNPSIFKSVPRPFRRGKNKANKKHLIPMASLQKLCSDSTSPEDAPSMAAGPNHIIFKGSRARARIASYLQCRRLRRGIIPCKDEGILCIETSAERRSDDGAFSPSCPPLGARQCHQKKLWKSEVATKVAASSNPSIFTVSRDHLEEGRTVPENKFLR